MFLLHFLLCFDAISRILNVKGFYFLQPIFGFNNALFSMFKKATGGLLAMLFGDTLLSLGYRLKIGFTQVYQRKSGSPDKPCVFGS